MDQFWQEAVDYVQAKTPMGFGYVVPDAFLDSFAGAVTYTGTAGRSPGEFAGVVVHKGIYRQIDASFLFGVFRSMKPTFANSVFVILEARGVSLLTRHSHLGTLTEIVNWAAANADPAIAQPEHIDEPNADMAPLDPSWREVVDYVQAKTPMGFGYVVPDALRDLFAGAVTYTGTAGRTPGEFAGVVIHKGSYREIDASFLLEVLRSMKPTFANAVFIILEVRGASLLARHSHLGILTEIMKWAATHADPAVTQPEDGDEPKAETVSLDQTWQEVVDYVQARSPSGLGYVVPDVLLDSFTGALSYSETASRTPGEFVGAVIHKGMYRAIDASFLYEAIRSMKPTFANAVFIVLEMTAARRTVRNSHVGTLPEIKKWAAANADPLIVQSSDLDEQKPDLVKSSDEILMLMAGFIVHNLAKPIDPAQREPVIAIAETPVRFNDTAWFWVDDTGKTAEMFAVPKVRDAYPELADATLDYVLRLSPDLIIQRRAAVPELKLVDGNPENFRAYNSFFTLSGDLTRGVILPTIRYNDDRARMVTQYCGNTIRFIYRGRRQTVDIEDTIKRWSIVEHPNRIVFSHTSKINGKALIGGTTHVCDVTYDYTLWCAQPSIELSVSVTAAAGTTLNDLQITTSFDQMSQGGAFETVITGQGSMYQTHKVPESAKAVLAHGNTDYVSMFESRGMPGFAIGLHAYLKDSNRLKDVVAEGSSPGHFHWVYARYGLGTLRGGETQSIVEDRLLTGGGYYSQPAIYRRLIADAATGTGEIDPSMSYDIGAELNAVAVTILFARRGLYSVSPPSDERVQTLKAWFDRHLDVYLAVARPGEPDERHRVFVRGLSFVILALDCMARAYEDAGYRSKLETCIQLLLRLEVPVKGGNEESLFSTQGPEFPSPPQLDCQSATLLALARAASWGDPDRRISDVIRRCLRAILVVSVSGKQYGQPTLRYNTILVREEIAGGREDTGYWNFKLGLALRAFNAVRQAQELGWLTLDPETLEHLGLLTERARKALHSSMRLEDDSLEVLTSQLSSETNSETQPWVALGLVPAIEWEILGRPKDTPPIRIPVALPEPLVPPSPAGARTYFDEVSPPIRVEWECSQSQATRMLNRVANIWEGLGRDRPHWSVLTADKFLPAHIATTEGEFFDFGQHDRNRLLATIQRAGRDPVEFKTVHEFGCGLGRITNYLSEKFESVIACDVSAPHLDRARARSTGLGRNNIAYHLSKVPDFGMHEKFDLWFTLFVLQHSPPPIVAMILRRAFKLLRPGGLAIFQIPTYAPHYQFQIEEYLASGVPESGIEMHFLPQSVLFKLVAEAGCSLIEVTEGDIGNSQWLSNTVVVMKYGV